MARRDDVERADDCGWLTVVVHVPPEEIADNRFGGARVPLVEMTIAADLQRIARRVRRFTAGDPEERRAGVDVEDRDQSAIGFGDEDTDQRRRATEQRSRRMVRERCVVFERVRSMRSDQSTRRSGMSSARYFALSDHPSGSIVAARSGALNVIFTSSVGM